MSNPTRSRLATTAVVAIELLIAAGSPASAQEAAGLATADAIASAVTSAREGTVWFQFAARPDAWGDGKRWNMGSLTSSNRRCRCTNGPVIVEVRVDEGSEIRLRSQVGGERGAGDDLGTVSAPAAAEYLLRLAARLPEKSAEEAIQAAVAALDAETWPALLDISRDRSRPADVRSTALFWVAHEAGVAAADELEGIAVASEEDPEVQEAAVFAITQLPGDRGTDLLLNIARSNRNPEIIETVFFWLGQSGDPRATDLFEEVLLR
ncbi:MAG: HEAT repeat domain-containing protein [Gemmatimonadota bacterium]